MYLVAIKSNFIPDAVLSRKPGDFKYNNGN